MQFNIEVNKDADTKNFLFFLEAGFPDIALCYPEIKNKTDAISTIEHIYESGEVEKRAAWLKKQSTKLNRIAVILSEIIGESWKDIDQIDIMMGTCPVCPRFLDTNTFCAFYRASNNHTLRLCAHEMTHFLYFKKLKSLLGRDDFNTEAPGYEWLLSELLVVPIVNNPRVLAITHQNETAYTPLISIPDEVMIKVQAMWNKDKMIEVHDQAYRILKKYTK